MLSSSNQHLPPNHWSATLASGEAAETQSQVTETTGKDSGCVTREGRLSWALKHEGSTTLETGGQGGHPSKTNRTDPDAGF